MNCVIGGPNVKCLAKAVHALARIGDDLYIENTENGLIFRTVNSSRSAYVCFTFKPAFFAEYPESSGTKCKISLKSCFMPFRSIPVLEKKVEKCVIDTAAVDCMVLIQFFCKHDMIKTYHLPLIENETVQAAFQDTVCPCTLVAQSRLLSDGIQNFSSSVEEVTLTVHTNKVSLKNYIDDDAEQDKVVHTEIILERDEFDTYEVEDTTEVTFCIKEFRAMLNFAEGFNVPITMTCQCGGKPIKFTIDSIPDMVSEFVLATLAERDSSSTSSQLATSSHSSNVITSKKKKKKSSKSSTRRSITPEPVELPEHSSPPPDVELNRAVFVHDISDDDGEHNNIEHSQMLQQDMGDADPEAEFVATTPPSKKFRSRFLGLSQESEYTSVLPDPDEILVAASDEDDD